MGDPVTVATDHYPLRYLATQPNLSGRQARWLDFLAEYDLSIEPQPGKDNTVADAVSRRPDYDRPDVVPSHEVDLYSIILKSDVMIANLKTSTRLGLRGMLRGLYDAKTGQYSQSASSLNSFGF